jgi:hypothetical protein
MEQETFLEPAEPATLVIEDAFRDDLLKTARWARFLALTGFAVLSFVLISAIVVFAMMPAFSGFEDEETIGQGLYFWMGIFNAVFIALFFYPVYTLYRFSMCLKTALSSNNSGMLGKAIRYQALMYRFYGVMTAAAIILYGVAILVGSRIFNLGD